MSTLQGPGSCFPCRQRGRGGRHLRQQLQCLSLGAAVRWLQEVGHWSRERTSGHRVFHADQVGLRRDGGRGLPVVGQGAIIHTNLVCYIKDVHRLLFVESLCRIFYQFILVPILYGLDV